MSEWRAIIFDLDDTLYPEREYVLSGFRAVARWAEQHLDIPENQGFTELYDLYMAGVRGDTFDRWLAKHAISSENVMQSLVHVYRSHQPTIHCCPGVPELLHSLHQHFRLGLVSDGYLEVQQRKLAALEIIEHFDAIVFSDKWGRESWKPSTRPFEEILAKLRVPPSAAVYVADNPVKDFLGAQKVGMGTVWVHRTDGEYAHLRPPSSAHAPDYEVKSLTELERLLFADRGMS